MRSTITVTSFITFNSLLTPRVKDLDRRHHIMVVSIVDLRSRTAIPEVEWFSHEKSGLDGLYVGTKKMSFNENKTENIDSYFIYYSTNYYLPRKISDIIIH